MLSCLKQPSGLLGDSLIIVDVDADNTQVTALDVIGKNIVYSTSVKSIFSTCSSVMINISHTTRSNQSEIAVV